jgi:hypothetical protein
MQEPIQQSGSEVAIVIYDAPLPPRYFRFSKRFLKSLLVVAPLLLGTLFLALFLWGTGVRSLTTPLPKVPQVLTEQNSQLLAMESEIKSLKASNAELVGKLSSPQTTEAGTEETFLLGVKKPYGMQNFTADKKISVDQFTVNQDANKVTLKFQVISTHTEQKVTGHILVFLLSDSVMMAYPGEANAALAEGIKYSQGEPFSVSRLRPTNAEFMLRLNGKTARFLIYIFSREGDLLLEHKTEPFNVEAKS